MIYGINLDSSIPAVGYTPNVASGGKIALPVAPASLVYSHLKHISGVPAPEGIQGVNISKLNILDVLIDQMSQIKKPVDRPESGIPETRLDKMIDLYIREISQARETKMPYRPTPAAEPGQLFSLLV